MALQQLVLIGGGIASGKSEAGRAAENVVFHPLETSGILHQHLADKGIPNPEDRDVRIGMAKALVDEFGKGVMGKLALEAAIASKHPRVVVCGIRHQDQIEAVKEAYRGPLLTLFIDADADLRLQRALERAEKEKNTVDPKRLEQQIAEEVRGSKTTDLEGTKAASDYVIDNRHLTVAGLHAAVKTHLFQLYQQAFPLATLL